MEKEHEVFGKLVEEVVPTAGKVIKKFNLQRDIVKGLLLEDIITDEIYADISKHIKTTHYVELIDMMIEEETIISAMEGFFRLDDEA